MSQREHTPGPWEYDSCNDEVVQWTDGEPTTICHMPTTEAGRPDPNGLLIAAVPNLLEACRDALAVFGGGQGDTTDPIFMEEFGAILGLTYAVSMAEGTLPSQREDAVKAEGGAS